MSRLATPIVAYDDLHINLLGICFFLLFPFVSITISIIGNISFGSDVQYTNSESQIQYVLGLVRNQKNFTSMKPRHDFLMSDGVVFWF